MQHKREVLIANTGYDPERMAHCVTRMLQRKVDGVAIMTSELDRSYVPAMIHHGVPLVFLDVPPLGLGDHAIDVNYRAGIYEGLKHLCELGHKDIAFISGPLALSSARVREEAFKSALVEAGLKQVPGWIQQGDHRAEGGHEAMLRILGSRKKKPTAVMASNDLTAVGAMGAIHESGLRIPEDMSVVGFDGIELGAYTFPTLTTLVVSRKELAFKAFHALQSRVDSQSGNRVKPISVVEPTLLVRHSTAAPAGRPRAGGVHKKDV